MSSPIKIIFYHLVVALGDLVGNEFAESLRNFQLSQIEITNDIISGMFQIVTTNSMKCFYFVI